MAVWVYKKKRGLPWNANAIISTQNTLLPPTGEVQDRLVPYVFRVLDAVGIRYGPCHTEVMLTPRGPILVEVNARMHGLQGPRLIELATGTSKASYVVDALMDGGALLGRCYVSPPGRFLYPLHKQCVQLVLISPVHGYLRMSIQDVVNGMQLPSLMEVLPAVQKGQYLRQSCDLPTAAGTLLLVHDSAEQIEADIHRIRCAEDKGELYCVSAEPLPESPKHSLNAVLRVSPETRPRLHSVEKVGVAIVTEDDVDEADMQLELTGLQH